ncbi:MAG TPA: class I adenylate-forming enzyme family protein [Mycobacteriales bacterium]|nr:class I adenylate-forming enzyme family protein [Mycobacteriales bacterium]
MTAPDAVRPGSVELGAVWPDGLGELVWPAGSADVLARLAAEAWPDRVAVRAGDRTVTFAELDAQVTRWAGVLRGLVGEGAVVAVAAVPGVELPAAYHGVIRSGNVVAPVNPLLPEPAWPRLLGAVRARAVLLGPELAARLGPALRTLPHLHHILPLDPAQSPTHLPPRSSSCCRQRRSTSDNNSMIVGMGELAAIMFTSGSTGPAKPVGLTHRNLTAGAAQVGVAHGLSAGSVVLNGLPIYHPMHLNAGLLAGVTQVLAGSPDPAAAVRTAERHRASHFYALPVQLARLAAHPELDRLRMPTVRVAATGGLALPPSTVDRLVGRFGFALLRGYGLTETAGLAHSELACSGLARSGLARSGLVRRPGPGPVGPALPGGETRVVDLETGAVLAAGQVGEVRVCGPQVFAGYADRPGESPVDPDGWFGTGDAGYLDADGCLHVLDRVADLFRCGGELVSPSSLERGLDGLAAVRECAVLGWAGDGADPVEGAVPAAFLVLAEDGDPAGVLAAANAALPPSQRIRRVEVLAELPRLPNGKLARTALRARLATAGADGSPDSAH